MKIKQEYKKYFDSQVPNSEFVKNLKQQVHNSEKNSSEINYCYNTNFSTETAKKRIIHIKPNILAFVVAAMMFTVSFAIAASVKKVDDEQITDETFETSYDSTTASVYKEINETSAISINNDNITEHSETTVSESQSTYELSNTILAIQNYANIENEYIDYNSENQIYTELQPTHIPETSEIYTSDSTEEIFTLLTEISSSTQMLSANETTISVTESETQQTTDEQEYQLQISDVQVKAGGQSSFTITSSNNIDINFLIFYIATSEYIKPQSISIKGQNIDKEYIILENYDNNYLFSTLSANITSLNASDMIITVNFKVDEATPIGDYEITLNDIQCYDADFFKLNMNLLKNGTITVY